jgi:uncharacterized membrane protein SpoIIM required for sporulation
MILLLSIGMWVGANQATRFGLPAEVLNMDKLKEVDPTLIKGMEALGFYSISGMSTIWLHNLRAVALATLLGVFSFGVLGVIILMAPLTLMGFIAEAASSVGISPLIFLIAFIMPHGLLELPAIILSGAAILRVGATLVTPAQGHTIGEDWLIALADWTKIMLALVIPLFMGAAALEVFITPRTAMMILGF